MGSAVAIAAAVVCLVGVGVRLSIRDSIDATGVVYYATPWPVLAALVMLVAGGLRLRNHSRWTRPVATVGLISLASWLFLSYSTSSTPRLAPSALTCLSWNTDHGRAGWSRIAQTIRSESADLVCLVEAGPTEPAHERFWQAAFPDHATGNLGSGILVLVRDGTIRQVGSGSIDGNARFRQFDVSCRGERLTVVVVDVRSTPWVSRRSALEKLVRLIKPLDDRPVLITGDFNTPSDSACFDTWRTPLKNAWEAAGNGFRPTWPVPLPMLDLDQCWGNRHVDFVHCRGGWSSWSDHRPLITTFTVNRPQ